MATDETHAHEVDRLEARMEQRWLAYAHAGLLNDPPRSHVEMERLYDAYVDALEVYIAAKQHQQQQQRGAA